MSSAEWWGVGGARATSSIIFQKILLFLPMCSSSRLVMVKEGWTEHGGSKGPPDFLANLGRCVCVLSSISSVRDGLSRVDEGSQ